MSSGDSSYICANESICYEYFSHTDLLMFFHVLKPSVPNLPMSEKSEPGSLLSSPCRTLPHSKEEQTVFTKTIVGLFPPA